ncbi:MAG: hypothetical protein M3P85_15945 [Actinomycetota bacterium]|nr:hypothetical protein [Actinomycetota bacterium]
MNAEERARMIETRKQPAGRPPERLWVRDGWRPFDAWQVPVEALALNVDNRRFAAERTWAEEKLGRPLDPENQPDDERVVEGILLDTDLDFDGDRLVGKPSKDYDALKRDWQRRHQESPLWIRPDGTVRNGNRRLAMLKRLQREEGIEGFEYVDVVILDPDEIDEVALFDMEQREQLTENLKVRYTDINLLLAIRDAAISRGIDWFDAESVDRVAGELQHVIGNNKAYAIVQLNAIRYMDAFLDDSGDDGKYHKLIRQIERFRDVGKAMTKLEADYPDDVPDMLRVLFAAIRAGAPHGKIRALRNIFLHDRPRYEQLLAQVDGIEETWEQAGGGATLAEPDVVDIAAAVDEDEDELDDDTPGPNVPNYPREDVRDAIDNAIDGFEASMTDDVAKTLRQILNRLEIVTSQGEKLSQSLSGEHAETVREVLAAIVAWADRNRHLVD